MENAAPALGVFGGTFDPVHLAHLRLAEEARQSLGLDQILWIPAGQPWHRDPPQASSAQRLDMVHAALAGNPAFQVDSTEVDSGLPSYTVPTLERLRTQFGNERPLVLLLGADAFAGLNRWHRWAELFELSHLAIACRPGFELSADQLPGELAHQYLARRSGSSAALTQSPAGAITCFAMTQLDISATRIRQILSSGNSARYLLPEAVIDYIHRHHLYQSP